MWYNTQWNKAIRRTTIGLCVLFAMAAGGLTCFAQWGNNASPYDNCPCIPARPYWGYHTTRWHRWPGVMYADMQAPTPSKGNEISPSQIDLPTPKNEAELKPPLQTETAPNETPSHAAPEKAPSNPFQTMPTNPPLEPAPEQEPEKNESGMELPSMDLPKESPSVPSDTSQPTPTESPSSAPDSDESKTRKDSLPGLDPDLRSPGATPGALYMWPGLQLRRCEASGAGHRHRDFDPPPVMPVAVIEVKKESPNSLRAKISTHDAVRPSAEQAAPELIAPSLNAQRLEPPKVEPPNCRLPSSNPLRADGIKASTKPSTWIKGEQTKREVVQPVNAETSILASGANPLRRN